MPPVSNITTDFSGGAHRNARATNSMDSALNTRSITVVGISIAACLLSTFCWHAATLRFAEFLMDAPAPIPGAQYRYIYTDVLGQSTPVYDPYMGRPEDYQRFINVAGRGSWRGLGRHQDRSIGVDSSMGFVLASVAAISLAGFLAGVTIPRLVAARLGNEWSLRSATLPTASLRGAILGAIVLVPGTLLVWYAAYPRMRFGAGVFEMHTASRWAIPWLATCLGLIAASFDLTVEWQLRASTARCQRCGYLLSGQAGTGMCMDCGFVHSVENIASKLGRRWLGTSLLVGAAIVGGMCLWMTWGPAGGYLGTAALARWFLMIPLDS